MPPIFLVAAAALLWSTGGVLIKATSLSPWELSFARSLLAAITVALLTRREGFGLNRVTGVAAVLYAALLILFVSATKWTTAANAIFLQYTAPVYVLLLEPWLFKERFRPRDAVVIGVCVAGMALFFVGRLRPQDVAGNLAALASGLCFALFTLSLRHPDAAKVNRASAVIYGNLLLAVVCVPAFWARGTGVSAGPPLTLHDAGIVTFLGTVQIGVAYTLFTRGIARGVRALDAGIVGYVEPVLNPIWVFLFLGERPGVWALAGGMIIVGAVGMHTAVAATNRKPSAAQNG